MAIFKKKKKYQKRYKVLSTKELGVKSEEEYNFAFWADPSRGVLLDFIKIFTTVIDASDEGKEADEIEEFVDINLFYELASEIIIECDIAGLDFSTPEKTEQSFNERGISSSFLSEVLSKYVLGLMTELSDLKNE